MYDIKPLENDWKKYKLKKRRPLYVFMATIFSSFILLYIYFLNPGEVFTVFDRLNKKIDSFSKSNSVKNPNSSQSSILINSSLNNLELYEAIEVAKEQSLNPSTELLVDIPILNVEETPLVESNVSKRKGKVHLDIFETSSATAYEDVEIRFRQLGDIDDALFLAKSYYKKGEFEKSKYWAFEANKLNSSLEESFFIFVKSKAKLGNMNEAVSLLDSYLNRTNSDEARTLLNQLKSGKI